jgi:hypothetical protein
MSDYLTNLVARTLDPSRVVQPRLASLFEPLPNANAQGRFLTFALASEEGDARPRASADETRAPAVPSSIPARNEGATREHSAPFHTQSPTDVVERRAVSSPREKSPAATGERAAASQLTAQTYAEQEALTSSAASAVSSKDSASNKSAGDALEAGRERRATSESERAPTPRAAPRVVEPRLSRAPTVSEAQPPPASTASDARREDAAPTIRVTIGRVDVRAVAPAPPERRRAPESSRPALTLEDYLRRRGGGSR